MPILPSCSASKTRTPGGARGSLPPALFLQGTRDKRQRTSPMNKSTKGLLLAVGVIGTVFGIAMVYLYISPPLDPNAGVMQRFEENQRIKGIALRWDSLDAGTRKTALPDLVKAWQLNDDEVRASATIALGNAGPDALPLLQSAVKS